MNSTSTKTSQSNKHEPTILIIDDNPVNLGVVSDYLIEYGFDILVARSGENGLKRAVYANPDIILLDVMMPGIDGFETCRELKANEETAEIPVIFMTALTSAEDKVKGFEAGAVDYVTKPLQQEEVLARVNTHLKIRNLTTTLKQKNQDLQKMADNLLTANTVLAKRAIQLEVNNRVGQKITSILELNDLLRTVVSLIQADFGYYFVGIWLVVEEDESIVLQAAVDNQNNHTIKPVLRLPLNKDKSIVGWVCTTGEAYLAKDVKTDPKYHPSEALPATDSEIVLPLKVGEDAIGALDIQSDYIGSFDEEDQKVLQTLANQIAIAIRNAQLYEAQKRLHRAEEEKAKVLSKLNANKDKFFSIISHDLRSPFTSLLGHTQLMLMTLDTLSPKDIHEIITQIYNSAKTAYDLLDNLLTWSRMERGYMEYEPEVGTLKTLVKNTFSLLEDTAKTKGVELVHTINNNHDPLIYSDETMIETVIRNLTANAIKFTKPEGCITISIHDHNPEDTVLEPSQFVEVWVADTGVGISEEDVNKLFRMDTHHSTAGTAKEQGTGLGLIICKEMVEINGGKIWIESEVGYGTTVKFTIPRAIEN